MGRRRTPGLRNRGGIWYFDTQIYGRKIRGSTGTGSLQDAEIILAHRIEEVRQGIHLGVRPERSFREAASKFLEDYLRPDNQGETATTI